MKKNTTKDKQPQKKHAEKIYLDQKKNGRLKNQ